MGFTSAGLTNGGKTAHFQVAYDDSFSTADGVNRSNAFLAKCEQDFALMQGWFAGVNFGFAPLSVQIKNAGGGASWSNSNITINAGPGQSVDFVRYLLVSEVVEQFMNSQSKGWFQGSDEGSKGEGLSRFLGVQFKVANALSPVPFPGFGVVRSWLNGGRPNFVDNNPDDNQPDPTNGCTTCFIYFLHSQLGFTINQIIAAAADTLAGVYTKLTGMNDAWTRFINLVNNHYPAGSTYSPAGDNIFPVSELSQFFAPNQITCGYSDTTQVFIDKPAMAEVNIQLKSDNPAVVSVPATVTIPVGGTSGVVTLSAPAIAGPFSPKLVNIHATYAGKTLTMAAEVVPPRVVSLTLSPNTVTCGDSSTATVTLNRPSLAGPVVANLICGAPGFAKVPAQVTIPQGKSAATFQVTTPAIQIAFKTAHASIYATYSDSTAFAQLTVKSKVVAGILSSLVILPTTINVGGTSRGTVTLIEAVPTPTVVGLAASEVAAVGAPGGHLPLPGNNSSVASVPAEITIPAGQTTGLFTITTNHNVMAHTKRNVSIMAVAVTFKYAALTVEG
ncbi:hypothetical protein AYO50_01400 [Acidobacteria bacterium SCGC AG-212-P17]|nr:hypothetical protein AYO50_01400 [Acidobacteria bacterium SCGC AG-212-P17]